MTKIVYLPSYSFIAHYSLRLKQIEICEFLKEYPELHNLVLEHEKEHEELFEERRYKSLLNHVWIDLRDYRRLLNDSSLWKEYKEFRKEARDSKKDIVFIFTYLILVNLGSILLFPLKILRILKDVLKK